MGTADVLPRARRRRVRGWIAALTAVLVATAAVVAGLDLSGRLPGGLVTDAPSAVPTPAAALDPEPSDAPAVLQREPSGAAPASPALPVAALGSVLTSGRLGPDPGALVLDVASGQPLLDRESTVARTPASLLKLATAAAALTTLDPASRLQTRVVAGAAPGELVLVGGGDTTLTTRRSPAAAYPVRASLARLADATATALRAAAPPTATTSSPVTVRVDDALFTGPAVSPDWPPTYVSSGVVSPVSALSLDAGRVSPTSDVRESDPAVATGERFSRLLAKRGVAVADEVRRTAAPPGAEEIAAAASPTVAELVELMLAGSDNDLAETLLRLVAVGEGRPGSFTDGTAVVVEVLTRLGVPTAGLQVLDGSGLARGSTVAPGTLGRLLATAADASQPGLGHLLGGLPVAGFSGTLALRYGEGRPGTAAGLVRAKTGTLTGVSTLAGLASVDGRPVVFVVMSDQVVGDALSARGALDRFAATLVGAP